MATNSKDTDVPRQDMVDEKNANITQSKLGQFLSRARAIQVALDVRLKQGDELVQFLQKKLEDNLKAQLTDSLVIRRQSVREMRTIKNQIYQGNLSLSEKNRDVFAGLYNRAIEESVKSNSILAKTASDFVSSVKGNLPSMDTILSAVSVANPVVGFGLRLTKDLIGSARNRKRAFEEERKKTLENLEDEARKTSLEDKAAQKQLDNEEAQEEKDKKGDGDIVTMSDKSVSDLNAPSDEWLQKIYTSIEQIKEHTLDLLGRPEDIKTDDPLDLLRESLQNDGTVKIDTADLLNAQEDLKGEIEKVADNTGDILSINEEEQRDNESERLQTIEDKREDKSLGVGTEKIAEEGKGKLGSIVSGITGMLLGRGGLGMLLGLAGAIIGTIISVLTGFVGLAAYIPGIAVVGAAFAAAKSFFDGWTDAAAILGKPENQIDFGDKIAAGLGSIGGLVGSLLDMITSAFGFDTNLEEGIKDFSAKFVAELIDDVESLLKSAVSGATEFFGKLGETIDKVIEWAKEKTKEYLPDFMYDWMWGNSSDVNIGEGFTPGGSDVQMGEVAPSARVSRAEALNSAVERAKAQGAAVPTVVAPSQTTVDNSRSTVINVPRSVRNDDRTLDRIERQTANGGW